MEIETLKEQHRENLVKVKGEHEQEREKMVHEYSLQIEDILRKKL
jgi:hypothetical protein